MKAAVLAVSLAVPALFASPAAGATVCNYTGPSGGSWHAPGVWDCAGGPTAADAVVLGTGDNVVVTSLDAAAASVTIDSSATLGFANAHKLDVSGTTTIGSGTVTGSGRLNANGGLTKTAGQVDVSSGVTVTLGADSTWSDGAICVQSASTVRINALLSVAAAAGALNCSSGDSLVQVAATGSIDVAGGTRTWFSQLDNDGSVKLDAGSLTLAAGSANSDAGAWSIAAPATLTLAASHGLGGTGKIGGDGTLNVVSGTTAVPDGATLNPAVLTLAGGVVNVDGTGTLALPAVNLQGGTLGGTRTRTITTLAAQSGILSGAQTTTISGSFVKSTAGQLTITGGTMIRPTIDTTWSAGDICITGASTFRVQNELDIAAGAGSFNCSSGDSLVQLTQTALIDVAGGTRTWFSQIDNDGSVHVDAGTLTLAAPSPNSDAGAWTIAAPATLTLAASHTLAGSGVLGGPGTLVISSGTTTVPDGATLNPATLNLPGGILNVDGTGTLTLPAVNLQGGTLGGTRTRTITTLAAQSGILSGAQTTTISGSFVKSTAGQLSVNGGTTVRATVDTTWSGGDICITGGSALQFDHALHITAGAGQFNCSSADSLVDVLAGSSVDIAGTPRTWFSRVRNAGAFTLDTALSFAAGFTNAGGTFTVNGTAGGAVAVAGGVLAGSGTLTGDVANTGGTVKPAGTLTINGNYTQGAGGTLEADLSADFDKLVVGGALALGGTLALVRAPAFDPPAGTKLQLITSASRTGSFATLTGATFSDRAFADDGSTPGFRLVVVNVPLTVGTPAITGAVRVGGTITCDEGTWGGAPAFKYVWLRDGAIVGTARTYVIGEADAGHQLTCHVSGTNGSGSGEATSAPVTVPAPVPTVSPTPTPSVTPVPTPVPTPTPPLQGATPAQVATAFGLPAANRCVGRRDYTIRLREPKGIKIKSAQVRVDGKAVKVRKSHGIWVAQVNLPRNHKSTFTVTIKITTTDNRVLTGKRVYRVCPKR